MKGATRKAREGSPGPDYASRRQLCISTRRLNLPKAVGSVGCNSLARGHDLQSAGRARVALCHQTAPKQHGNATFPTPPLIPGSKSTRPLSVGRRAHNRLHSSKNVRTLPKVSTAAPGLPRWTRQRNLAVPPACVKPSHTSTLRRRFGVGRAACALLRVPGGCGDRELRQAETRHTAPAPRPSQTQRRPGEGSLRRASCRAERLPEGHREGGREGVNHDRHSMCACMQQQTQE